MYCGSSLHLASFARYAFDLGLDGSLSWINYVGNVQFQFYFITCYLHSYDLSKYHCFILPLYSIIAYMIIIVCIHH